MLFYHLPKIGKLLRITLDVELGNQTFQILWLIRFKRCHVIRDEFFDGFQIDDGNCFCIDSRWPMEVELEAFICSKLFVQKCLKDYLGKLSKFKKGSIQTPGNSW